MDDLISRKALLEAAEHNVEFQEGIVDVYILESILAGMPAVDAAPVVHGEYGEPRWIPKKFFRCSVCRKGTAVRHNFCPNCGAKMNGGNDDEN